MPKNPDRDTLPPLLRGSEAIPYKDRTRPLPARTTSPGIGIPAAGTTEESDRDVLLRTFREMESRFEQRLAESRRATAAADLAPKKRDWGDLATKAVAALGVIAGTLGMLKPSKDDRVAPAYEELGRAVKTLESHQLATDSSLEQIRAWLSGYLQATGVKVAEPKGAPPATIVELQPAPLVANDRVTASQAPAIQVKTPLPAPPPSTKPIVLKPLSRE